MSIEVREIDRRVFCFLHRCLNQIQKTRCFLSCNEYIRTTLFLASHTKRGETSKWSTSHSREGLSWAGKRCLSSGSCLIKAVSRSCSSFRAAGCVHYLSALLRRYSGDRNGELISNSVFAWAGKAGFPLDVVPRACKWAFPKAEDGITGPLMPVKH